MQTIPVSRSGLMLLFLLLIFVSLRSLSYSQRHLFPVDDEIDYLQLAREVKATGLSRTLLTYVRGENTYADRNPLYVMVMSPLMDGTPRDFARGKLAGLALMWLLMMVVYFLSTKRWGEHVGLAAVFFIALSPLAGRLSQRLLADTLFTTAFFSALMLFFSPPRRSTWVAAGGLTGIAYLTKDNGYLLLAVPVAVEILVYRSQFFRRTNILLVIISFISVSFFLLIRNWLVGGTLFYNSINQVFWLDDWREFCLYRSQPIWNDIGASWYFSNHSIADVAMRIWQGFSSAVMILVMSMGFGFDNKLFQFTSGLFLLTLAILGVLRQWQKGARQEVVALLTIGALMMAGLTWITPATGVNFRYGFPLAIALIPFAAISLRRWERYGKKTLFVIVAAGIAALNPIRLVQHNPLNLWQVPPFWMEMSGWIRTHLENEPFIVSHASNFSMWGDAGPDRRQPFPYNVPTNLIVEHLKRNGIRYALIDQSVITLDPFVEKYGPHDKHGPIKFLDWQRCYHDSLEPSILLLYGADCVEDKNALTAIN